MSDGSLNTQIIIIILINYNAELRESSALAGRFDHETLLVSGNNLRGIVNRVSHFAINNYQSFFKCEMKWSFFDAFFFAGTIARDENRIQLQFLIDWSVISSFLYRFPSLTFGLYRKKRKTVSYGFKRQRLGTAEMCPKPNWASSSHLLL